MLEQEGFLLDAMCGTGTGTVCALKLGMHAIAFDQSKQTCLAALTRLAKIATEKYVGPEEELYTALDWKAELLKRFAQKTGEQTQKQASSRAVDLTGGETGTPEKADQLPVEEDEVLVVPVEVSEVPEAEVEAEVEAEAANDEDADELLRDLAATE